MVLGCFGSTPPFQESSMWFNMNSTHSTSGSPTSRQRELALCNLRLGGRFSWQKQRPTIDVASWWTPRCSSFSSLRCRELFLTLFYSKMCFSLWWQEYFYLCASFSFDPHIMDWFKMFIKLCIKSTSVFSKIDVENNPYKGSPRFFVLNFVTFQWTRWYLHRPCWDEFCLWQKPCSAQRLPWPLQSQGFHECTKRISHRCVRNQEASQATCFSAHVLYIVRHDDVL